MPITLKPCPFCGSSKTKPSLYESIWFVVCENCHADGPAKDTKNEAIAAWNKRHARHDGHGA